MELIELRHTKLNRPWGFELVRYLREEGLKVSPLECEEWIKLVDGSSSIKLHSYTKTSRGDLNIYQDYNSNKNNRKNQWERTTGHISEYGNDAPLNLDSLNMEYLGKGKVRLEERIQSNGATFSKYFQKNETEIPDLEFIDGLARYLKDIGMGKQ